MTIPNVKLLRDLVLIRPMPLALKKTADGIIIPGDVDKMAPKRATVISTGPGTYDKSGKFVKSTCSPGDQILYMERNLIPTKIDGEDFFILQQEDVILKFSKVELEDDSLPEMTDAAYNAETLRRVLIKHLTDCGLTRVQDMSNPTDVFTVIDGSDSLGVKCKSYLLESEETIMDFNPPDDAKAFSIHKLNFVQVNGLVSVVVHLAFLPRSDVTLG